MNESWVDVLKSLPPFFFGLLNTCMNKYQATIKVKGQTIRTQVNADTTLHATIMLEYQFGMGCLVGTPTLIGKSNKGRATIEGVAQTIKPIKPIKPIAPTTLTKTPKPPSPPKSPEQSRINQLKTQKDAVSKNLDAERNRQKIAKAQAQIRSTSLKNL